MEIDDNHYWIRIMDDPENVRLYAQRAVQFAGDHNGNLQLKQLAFNLRKDRKAQGVSLSEIIEQLGIDPVIFISLEAGWGSYDEYDRLLEPWIRCIFANSELLKHNLIFFRLMMNGVNSNRE